MKIIIRPFRIVLPQVSGYVLMMLEKKSLLKLKMIMYR